MEGVVCLANRAGNGPAWLLVGVEDDGRVTGARPRHGAGVTDPLRIQALIANQTRPSLACRVELVELEGRPVLVVEVPPARTPVGTADGTYVRRAIGSDGRPACLPFHFHEMQALQASRGVLDYSALTIPEASWDDLDPLEFERFRRNIRESGGQGDASLLTLPNLELAKALGAVDANHYPGGFPEGVRLDNLLVTPPRPRNPLLADAFKRAGLVERTGRGIDTIFYEQLKNGRPAPSYERSTATDVVVVLPGGAANFAFVRLVTEENRAGRALSLDELLILNKLWQERRLTTPESARVIQKPEPEARAVLERLVEAGLVEGRGERRGRSYHLSPETYRRLHEPAAYVRLRGFEPIQQRQMVLQFARAYGRITRAQAAELCKITPSQAYRLLRRLAEEGQLMRHGTGKGAWYEPRA